MWIRFFAIFGTFVTILLVDPSSGLQCYVCSGDLGTNNDCEVNLDNVIQSDCTPGFVCSVYVTKEGNRSTVHRICEAENECEVIQAQSTHILPTSSNRTIESCRTCKTSLCNSSVFYKGSSLSLILGCVVVVVTLVLNKFQ